MIYVTYNHIIIGRKITFLEFKINNLDRFQHYFFI